MVAGLLPSSRASVMMDVVATAMVIIVPLLTYSIYLVRFRKQYATHKRLQLATFGTLLLTVLLFEIDVRLNGWRHLAVPSPYYDSWLFPLLYVHLVFAISTTTLWIVTVTHALRRLPSPPAPSTSSALHKRLGRLTALGTYCTSVTGWIFYWAAFIA